MNFGTVQKLWAASGLPVHGQLGAEGGCPLVWSHLETSWVGGGRGSLALVTAEGPHSSRRPGCCGGGKMADSPRYSPLRTRVHVLRLSLERKSSLLKAPKPPAETHTCLPSTFPPSSTSNLRAPDELKRGSLMAQKTRDPLEFSTELSVSTSAEERSSVSGALCHPIG